MTGNNWIGRAWHMLLGSWTPATVPSSMTNMLAAEVALDAEMDRREWSPRPEFRPAQLRLLVKDDDEFVPALTSSAADARLLPRTVCCILNIGHFCSGKHGRGRSSCPICRICSWGIQCKVDFAISIFYALSFLCYGLNRYSPWISRKMHFLLKKSKK